MIKHRRSLRELEVLDEIVSFHGVVVPCWRCKKPLTTEDIRSKNVQNEHLHEHALGGADDPHNRRFSHVACHKAETFGTGSTTAGSSIGRIAKAKRIERTQKFVVNKPLLGGDCHDTGPIQNRRSDTKPVVHAASLLAEKKKRRFPPRPFPKVHRPMRKKAST